MFPIFGQQEQQQQHRFQLQQLLFVDMISITEHNLLMDPSLNDMLLPKEILLHVFSYLETAQEIQKCALVSKFYQNTASEPALWRGLADQKYSSRVVEETIQCYYDGNYKSMVVDDNKRGALPTLDFLLKGPPLTTTTKCSSYRYNTSRYFFSCLLTCIRYDLESNKLQLFIDARGERDLREPWSSGIWRHQGAGSTINTSSAAAAVLLPVLFRDLIWNSSSQTPPALTLTHSMYRSLLPRERAGHYKGILEIDGDFFNAAAAGGSYVFCYANSRSTPFVCDYNSVELFEIKEGETLMDVFSIPTISGSSSSSTHRYYYYTSRDDSPFANDDEASEKERWGPYLPSDDFLNQRSYWWVSD